MPNGLHPDLMTPAERLDEIAEILAAGILRLRARQRAPQGSTREQVRVELRRDGERFLIVNDDGHVVGRLAKKYRAPEGLRFLEGRVFAIVTRKDGDAADAFRGRLRRASWEVVVPELVFGPDR